MLPVKNRHFFQTVSRDRNEIWQDEAEVDSETRRFFKIKFDNHLTGRNFHLKLQLNNKIVSLNINGKTESVYNQLQAIES